MEKAEIDRRFLYYRADPEMVGRFQEIRELFRELAHKVFGPLPDSQEAGQAAVHLDESLRWVFAAIIRPGKESSGEQR
jgi:hypothetical protein